MFVPPQAAVEWIEFIGVTLAVLGALRLMLVNPILKAIRKHDAEHALLTANLAPCPEETVAEQRMTLRGIVVALKEQQFAFGKTLEEHVIWSLRLVGILNAERREEDEKELPFP